MKYKIMGMIIVGAALAGFGWWHFVGSRRLSESDVRAFLHAQDEAMQRLDSKALCAGMADDFHGTETTVMEGHRTVHSSDKASECAQYGKMAAMKGAVTGRSENKTLDIRFSPDHRQAAVTRSMDSYDQHRLIAHGEVKSLLVRRDGRIVMIAGDSIFHVMGTGVVNSADAGTAPEAGSAAGGGH